MAKIAEKIQTGLGLPDLIRKLTEEIPPSDLNSLLLEVYRKMSQQISAASLLKNYENNKFVAPVKNDPIKSREFELTLLKLAKEQGFYPIDLSPLAPFASCSAIATVDQNKIVSATRGTEAVADATNILALESSKRRKQANFGPAPIQMCTVHRHVRGQVFKTPGFLPHFKIFCVTSAGRDTGNFAFEKQSLLNQFSLFEKYLKDYLGVDNLLIRLKALNTPGKNFLYYKVCDFIEPAFKNITFQRTEANAEREQYYKHLQFKIIFIQNEKEFEIGDGGFVDWSQQLTGNKKERLLISGIGIEFLYNLLKPTS